jgi:hypothetical protein
MCIMITTLSRALNKSMLFSCRFYEEIGLVDFLIKRDLEALRKSSTGATNAIHGLGEEIR